MTLAVRLNEDICQKSGVRIMLSGGDSQSMRLGFYRGNIDFSSLGSTEGRGGIKSVRIDPASSSQRYPLIYEALPESPPTTQGDFLISQPCYKVFGVWIPLQDMVEGRQEGNAEVWWPGSQALPDAWLV